MANLVGLLSGLLVRREPVARVLTQKQASLDRFHTTTYFFFLLCTCLLLLKQFFEPITCLDVPSTSQEYVHSYCWIYGLDAWKYGKSCDSPPFTYHWAPLVMVFLTVAHFLPSANNSTKASFLAVTLTCCTTVFFFGFRNSIDAGLGFFKTPASPKNDTNWCSFPKIAECNIEHFGPSGTVQLHTYICTLSYNLYIEKISVLIVAVWIVGALILMNIIFGKPVIRFLRTKFSQPQLVDNQDQLDKICEEA